VWTCDAGLKKELLTSPLIFYLAFEVLKKQTQKSYPILFFWGCQFPVSTGSFPTAISCSLTNQHRLKTTNHQGISGFLLVECVAG
jgi:hypothetical protein